MDRLTPIYQAPPVPNLQEPAAPLPSPPGARKKGRGKDTYSRLHRVAPDAAPLKDNDLTERDIAVIEAIQRYRVLSTAQIRTLLFPGIGPDQPRTRLRKLFHSGYLFRDA